MESRFHHSFSRVRVHADSPADASAATLPARAYTLGPHIAFALGAYDPTTDGGTRLLAHELTHVVQQSRTHGSSSESEAENEAAQIADAAAADRQVAPAKATPVRITRRPTTATAERELEVEAIDIAGRSYVLYRPKSGRAARPRGSRTTPETWTTRPNSSTGAPTKERS